MLSVRDNTDRISSAARACLATILSMVVLFLSACDSSRWIEFTPPDHAFVVSLPAQPKQREFPDVPPSHIKMTQYAITTNEITFAIHFTELPAKMTAASTPDEMLDSGIDPMFAPHPQARKVWARDMFHGFPSRTFTIDDPAIGYIAVGRSCMVGRRIYVIQVVRPARVSAAREISRFMESFRFETKPD